MSKQLILTVTEHRKFGVIFAPYIITPTQGNTFYSSIERANTVNVKDVEGTDDVHYELVKLISEYDDNYIANLFTKKTEDAKNFIQNVDYDFINLRIRPHIEKRLIKILNLIPKLNIQLYYKDRKYAKIYRSDEILPADSKAKAIFNFNRNTEGIQYYLSIKHNNEEIKLKNKKPLILTQQPSSIVVNNRLYIFKNIDSKKLLPFFTKDHIAIPKQTEKAYFEKFVLNTIKQFDVKAKGFEITEEELECKPIFYLQNDMAGKITLLLKYKYGSKVILPNNPEIKFVTLENNNDDYQFIKNCRNTAFEKHLNNKFSTNGLNTKDNVHFYSTNQTDSNDLYNILDWINTNANFIEENNIEIRQDFFDRKYYTNTINLSITIKDENDWFDIRGTVELGEFKIPFIKLRKNILQHIREYVLPDDTVAILPEEWFVKYKEIFLFAEHNSKGLVLSKMHFNLLNQNTIGIRSDTAAKIKELFNQKYTENSSIPDDLNATMRPYQVTGYNWMNHLKAHNFGGCLADDMGLGKTIQTLALLLDESKQIIETVIPDEDKKAPQLSLFDQAVSTNSKKTTPTNLIVMPASLIHNWKNEAAKFTPALKTFVHTGNNRTKDIWKFTDVDIVLTTYGVIRNDYNLLKSYTFNYIVLDESQVIKNPDSKIYKAIIQLQGKRKLVLTGTPIENSLTDLWSQLNFVNRGLLGSFNFFKKEFVLPIEKSNNENKSEKLQALIHPFILRRTKEQVAKDLPPKTEQMRICEMSEAQRKIYEEEKALVRNSILENMEKNGVNKSSMMVLQALTKLRQISNHPELVDANEESGKFNEVIRVLNNIIAEDHKVLIFSSFTQHLDIYAKYLKENNIKYSILTGKTQKREKVIEEFQGDKENRVFLISLKAGGVGLNLTAADYVFLLDPWWNPAAENQAVNRAHRIGQDKKVFIYRFISGNSIEEKIVNLQNRKSELAELFINTNNPFKEMSPAKIKELFD